MYKVHLNGSLSNLNQASCTLRAAKPFTFTSFSTVLLENEKLYKQCEIKDRCCQQQYFQHEYTNIEKARQYSRFTVNFNPFSVVNLFTSALYDISVRHKVYKTTIISYVWTSIFLYLNINNIYYQCIMRTHVISIIFCSLCRFTTLLCLEITLSYSETPIIAYHQRHYPKYVPYHCRPWIHFLYKDHNVRDSGYIILIYTLKYVITYLLYEMEWVDSQAAPVCWRYPCLRAY